MDDQRSKIEEAGEQFFQRTGVPWTALVVGFSLRYFIAHFALFVHRHFHVVGRLA